MTYIPQHITYDEVIKACQKAYKEKRLLAQSGPNEGYGYRTSHGVCAIGAVLTTETLDFIDDHRMKNETVDMNVGEDTPNYELQRAFTWPEEETLRLAQLQSAHDRWLEGNENEDNFLRVLGL